MKKDLLAETRVLASKTFLFSLLHFMSHQPWQKGRPDAVLRFPRGFRLQLHRSKRIFLIPQLRHFVRWEFSIIFILMFQPSGIFIFHNRPCGCRYIRCSYQGSNCFENWSADRNCYHPTDFLSFTYCMSGQNLTRSNFFLAALQMMRINSLGRLNSLSFYRY